MKPFSEDARPEQGNGSDPFYTTGSIGSIGEDPGSFRTSLSNKEQIRLSFAVKNKVQMLPNSSSIYYFNTTAGQWNIPSKALSDHVGPFEKFAYSTAWYPPSGSSGIQLTGGSVFIEDAKGFDAYGRPICSGSLDIFRQTGNKNQSIDVIGKGYNSAKDIFPYLAEDYEKSVQRSSQYDALSDEMFQINIDKPFLIEKVVIEFPFSAGSTWFSDMTSTCLSYGKGVYGSPGTAMPPTFYYDKGGPVLTLSLFCQKIYGSQKIRDLVLSETITHLSDSVGFVGARLFDYPVTEGSATNPLVLIEARGYSDSSCVITNNSQSQFTGSAVVKSTAGVSNGASGYISTIYLVGNAGIGTAAPGASAITLQTFLTSCIENFSKPTTNSSDIGPSTRYLGFPTPGNLLGSTAYFTVSSLDPFGRGMSGFAPSGGSIFGGEYVTPQVNINGISEISNPYYIKQSERIVESVSNISSTFNNVFKNFGYSSPPTAGQETSYVVNVADSSIFVSNKASPYLVYPEDKFVLSISKTRPAISGSEHIVPNSAAADIGLQTMTKYSNLVGSSSGHDVCLSTGSINITFYGSYVRGGNSYIP